MTKFDYKLFSGFYRKSIDERRKIISETLNLNDNDRKLLSKKGYIDEGLLDKFSENVISFYELPFSVVPGLILNGKEYIVPMVIEESSVVAAANKAIKIARQSGIGFKAKPITPIMIGQIQIDNFKSGKVPEQFTLELIKMKEDILKNLNSLDPVLVKHGGGAKDIVLRKIEMPNKELLILHILVDVRDAMGANIVNTMAEYAAKLIADRFGLSLDGNYDETPEYGEIILKIISNLAIYRIAKVECEFSTELLGGKHIVRRILDAYALSKYDIYRAATHNKGIMNAIDAIAVATGNDFRALEAGAHAYAIVKNGGKYGPLTDYRINDDGNLIGTIEIPIQAGIIGGLTRSHPMAELALKIMRVESSGELAQVMAAVGLAQNLAALRALCSEGIQEGHMKLHRRKSENK